jgi:hypothetical protein
MRANQAASGLLPLTGVAARLGAAQPVLVTQAAVSSAGGNGQLSDVRYELSVSRIFAAPRSVVSRAFTDGAGLAAWSGPAGMRLPPAPVAANFERLEGPGQLPGIPEVGAPGMLRLDLYDQLGDKTRLELWRGSVTGDQDAEARAWWNDAFGRLDEFLPHAGN